MSLILRQQKGSKLTISEMDGNLIYLDQIVSGLNYTFVKGKGSPSENGIELQTAYHNAKLLTNLSENNIFTIIVAPGVYDLPTVIELDTPFINITSLTGDRDVILGRFDIMGDPLQIIGGGEDPIEVLNTSPCIVIKTDYTSIRGLVGKKYDSSNWNIIRSAIDSSENYYLPINIESKPPNEFEVGGPYEGVLIKNCQCGPFSFGSTDFMNGSVDIAANFSKCEAGSFSFNGHAYGLYEYCVAKHSSFSSGNSSFSSGKYLNCIGERNCFGSWGYSYGFYKQCEALENSFGAFGEVGGIYIECSGGENSWYDGDLGVFEGHAERCRLFGSDFPTPSIHNSAIILCINGMNEIINKYY